MLERRDEGKQWCVLLWFRIDDMICRKPGQAREEESKMMGKGLQSSSPSVC